MRFDRPIGTLLLLWPTWWGLFFAGGGQPSLAHFAIFTAGVVIMRAAGCVINDYADRHIDPQVARTRDRPLATGEIQPNHAILLFFGLVAAAFVLVLFTNRLTILLAFGGALLAGTYPFFKRFTHFPQLVLGVAFGWAIPMTFAAETGAIPPAAWWLFGITVIWTLIYDTLYAMVDREDDIAAGVKSTAVFFGRFDLPTIAVLMGIMTACLMMFGMLYLPHPAWYAGVGVAFVLFQVQMWWIRHRQPDACFRAFIHNNWVGMVIFAGLIGALQI